MIIRLPPPRGSAQTFVRTFMRQANVSAHGRPVVAAGMLVAGAYLRTLGVPMAIGLHGVTSYATARRASEIWIRLA